MNTLDPLTISELQDARAIAERLAVEMTRLIASVDAPHRNSHSLARYLEVERTAVQRLYAAMAAVDETMLARSPGPKTLRRFAEAIKEKGIDNAIATGFSDAAGRFEQFLATSGGNQNVFAQRLQLTFQASSVELPSSNGSNHQTDDLDTRRDFFNASRETVGSWTDTYVRIAAVRPSAVSLEDIDVLGATGHIGHLNPSGTTSLTYTRGFDMFEQHAGPSLEAIEPLDHSVDIEQTYGFRGLSSPGWRQIKADDRVLKFELMDPVPWTASAPADIVHAYRASSGGRNPLVSPHRPSEFWSIIEHPCRRLIADLYLHKDLVEHCNIQGDAHAIRDVPHANQTHYRWMTRMVDEQPVQQLGRGLRNAGSAWYTRHKAMTTHIFELGDWNPDDFYGYRFEVRYPVWMLAYRIMFGLKDQSAETSGLMLGKEKNVKALATEPGY